MSEKYDVIRLGFLLVSEEILKQLQELFNNFVIKVDILDNYGNTDTINWKPFFVDIATNNLNIYKSKIQSLQFTTHIHLIDLSINGAIDWFSSMFRERYALGLLPICGVETYIVILPNVSENEARQLWLSLNEVSGNCLFSHSWRASSPECNFLDIVKTIYIASVSISKIVIRKPDISYDKDVMVNIGSLLINQAKQMKNIIYSEAIEYETKKELEAYMEFESKTDEALKVLNEEELVREDNSVLGKYLEMINRLEREEVKREGEPSTSSLSKEPLKTKIEKDKVVEQSPFRSFSIEEELMLKDAEIKEYNISKEVKKAVLPKIPKINIDLPYIKYGEIYYFASIKGGVGLTSFLINLCKKLSMTKKVVYIDMNFSHPGDALFYLNKKQDYIVEITKNFHYYCPVVENQEEYDIAIVDLGPYNPLLFENENLYLYIPSKVDFLPDNVIKLLKWHIESISTYLNENKNITVIDENWSLE